MANRRMFSMKVIDTDAFCEMPPSTQNLYFHIGMRADDDGFYASTRGLMLKINSSPDDLKLLIAKGFLLDRGDGVYVVKHWKMNNYLQKDRYQPTEYEEKAVGLFMKKDGSYTLHEEKGVQSLLPKGKDPMYTKVIQDVHIGKDSIGKVSIVKDSLEKERIDYPEEKEIEESSISIPANWDKPINPNDETRLNRQGFKIITVNEKKIIVPLSYQKEEGLSETDWDKELEDVD